jgi:hypothetical protein
MTWCSKVHLLTLGLTTLCVGLWASPSLAQTSPTTTFDQKTVDIFDTTEGQSFNPLDLIHQANFSREDPFSFFQRQQNNLNSEFSDFRSRQLEQLRDQGYEPPSLATESPATDAQATDGQAQEIPSTIDNSTDNATESETILRINLPEDSSLTPSPEPSEP